MCGCQYQFGCSSYRYDDETRHYFPHRSEKWKGLWTCHSSQVASRCQFTSHRRQISDKKAKWNVTAKCSIAENVQNVNIFAFVSKKFEISEERKKLKFLKNVFSVQQENLSASNFPPHNRIFFSPIRSYLYYLYFFPTFRIKMSFFPPYFVFPYIYCL